MMASRAPLSSFSVSSLFVLLLLTFLAQLPSSRGSSITFELSYGQRKCFAEELPPKSTCRGTVHVSAGGGEMTLDLFVSSNHGAVVFHKQDVNSVKFSFETAEYQAHTLQSYQFCIVNQVHPHSHTTPGTSRRITLKVEVNRHARESLQLAKQEHADKIYSEFSSVSESVHEVIEQLDELREKEKEITLTNERTTTTIFRLSLIACVFTIATGFANFLSLKTFFKRKKLA